MKQYYSIPQAAKICSVNSSTMYRWVSAGKIDSYKTAGGHSRILPQDLKKWIKKNNIPVELNEFESDKAKILIVDDEAIVRNYLKKALAGNFLTIDFAADGFEAGKKTMEFRPHLIILDLFMPNMDGFEVCKNLKSDSQTKKIKILILSGQLTDENRKKALFVGADAVLQKPSSKKELLDCIKVLLGKEITI